MARDLTKLHPKLQAKIARLRELCEAEGLVLGIGECVRTTAEQDALYAQGRTKPGGIVTYAKGSDYMSQHQWGIAFDFYKNIAGHAYDDLAFFDRIGALGKSLGLAWGGDWDVPVDRPHLYLPDWGDMPTPLKAAYGKPDNFFASWDKPSTSPDPEEIPDTPASPENSNDPGDPQVRRIQTWLNDHYLGNLDADGHYGPLTKAALVRAFQIWHNLTYDCGLVPDGIFGPRTKAASTYVERGGDDQKHMLTYLLQGALYCNGYDPAGFDGIYGNGCRAAVERYQKDHGLTVDGIAGKETFASLLA